MNSDFNFGIFESIWRVDWNYIEYKINFKRLTSSNSIWSILKFSTDFKWAWRLIGNHFKLFPSRFRSFKFVNWFKSFMISSRLIIFLKEKNSDWILTY